MQLMLCHIRTLMEHIYADLFIPTCSCVYKIIDEMESITHSDKKSRVVVAQLAGMVDVARRSVRREYRVRDFSIRWRKLWWFFIGSSSDHLVVILDTAAVGIWSSLLGFLVGFGRRVIRTCFLRLEEVAEGAPATAAAHLLLPCPFPGLAYRWSCAELVF